MEYIGMIKNSFNYVFSDTNKLVKLYLPSFVVALMVSISMMLIMFASNTYYSYNNPYSAIIGLGIFSVLTGIIGIFVSIINWGIMGGVIKSTLSTNELPEFKIGDFFVDGIKILVVSFLYGLIPLIIVLIFLGLGIAAESGAIIQIGILIYYILYFIISLLLPVAYGRLLETDSISEALSIGNIWQISKSIGLVEIFVLLFICGLISGVILFLSLLILFIPIIGPFISAGLVTLILLFMARIYGLIYLEQNRNNNYYQPNHNYQQNTNNASSDNKNLLIVCVTIILCISIIAGTLIILSQNGTDDLVNKGLPVQNKSINVNSVTFYSDGNPNTGETATINVGPEFSGEQIGVMTLYSRDGVRQNYPSDYENHTVSADGDVVITDYTAMPRYPGHCVIKIKYNGNIYQYECDIGTYKGTQTIVPEKI